MTKRNSSPGSIDLPELRNSLPISLLRAREAVMSRFRPILARHDLTEQQWRVLRVLAAHGELDASELSAGAFVLAPSLTRIVRSLEERGLIERRKDDDDARRALFRNSAVALKIIDEVAPESRAVYAQIEKAFGRTRLADLLRLLDELADLTP